MIQYVKIPPKLTPKVTLQTYTYVPTENEIFLHIFFEKLWVALNKTQLYGSWVVTKSQLARQSAQNNAPCFHIHTNGILSNETICFIKIPLLC